MTRGDAMFRKVGKSKPKESGVFNTRIIRFADSPEDAKAEALTKFREMYPHVRNETATVNAGPGSRTMHVRNTVLGSREYEVTCNGTNVPPGAVHHA